MNLAVMISAYDNKDDWLQRNLDLIRPYTAVTVTQGEEGEEYDVELERLEQVAYFKSSYSHVSLNYHAGIGIVTYNYETRCMIHLLDYLFSRLPINFDEQAFRRVAYEAVHHYEYDGSVYLLKEDRDELDLELTTCSICGARGDTNAHNTCNASACLNELDRILEGM